jgi:lipopolysaccharide transport system ATP-binding protein
MKAAIRIENLGKRFRRYQADRPRTLKEMLVSGWRPRGKGEQFWALRHVDLEVAAGEMVGIVGQNGAGKSTLLQLTGGVGTPDEGSARVLGRIGALLDLGAGFSGDLTGRENVFVTGVAAGLTIREVRRRFDRIVSFAELEDSIDNPVRTYSSGMQMRLGFSVAVHTDPQVLLVDEFLSVGDLAFQTKCLNRIKEIKSNGCAILLISHSPSQINELCDRAIWLRRGEVVVSGLPEVVTGQYEVEMRSETRRRTPHRPTTLAASGLELEVNRNRFGSLEVEILDVRLNPADQVRQGEAVAVAIEFRASKPVRAPRFNVGISRAEDGFSCLDLNSDVTADRAEVSGTGRVTLSIKRLDLVAGHYYVNVGVFQSDWEYAYDYHWEVYPLRVEGVEGSKGVLGPPFRWELEAH